MAKILQDLISIAIEQLYFPENWGCLHCILWWRASGFGRDFTWIVGFTEQKSEPNVILIVVGAASKSPKSSRNQAKSPFLVVQQSRR